MQWRGAVWDRLFRVSFVMVCLFESTQSVVEDRKALRLAWTVLQPPAGSDYGSIAVPYRHLCEMARLRGGDASWGRDASQSSEMGRGSQVDWENDVSLHPSELELSDASATDADGNRTDPALLAQRYYALPASSRQLLDDLVRFKWKQVTNESGVTESQPHDDDDEPLTGMKLEEVWDGDEQLCVRVVEAYPQSGVQAGDVVKTVEGIDCTKKSIAEVGHLIAEANAMKTSVQIGMLRHSIYSNAGTDGPGSTREGGGAAESHEHMYSLVLERGWLVPDEKAKVKAADTTSLACCSGMEVGSQRRTSPGARLTVRAKRRRGRKRSERQRQWRCSRAGASGRSHHTRHNGCAGAWEEPAAATSGYSLVDSYGLRVRCWRAASAVLSVSLRCNIN